MKSKSIAYWLVTVLFAAFMTMTAVPDILRVPDAVMIIGHLGYPVYLLPFLGVAKILGAVTVLFPGSNRLKEWAYAGLVFDMVGALYSHLNVGDGPDAWIFSVIGLTLATVSYVIWRSRLAGALTYPENRQVSEAVA